MLKDKYLTFFRISSVSWVHGIPTARAVFGPCPLSLAIGTGYYYLLSNYLLRNLRLLKEGHSFQAPSHYAKYIQVCTYIKFSTKKYIQTYYIQRILTDREQNRQSPSHSFAKKRKKKPQLKGKQKPPKEPGWAGPIQAGTGQRNLGQHLGKMARGDGFGENRGKGTLCAVPGPLPSQLLIFICHLISSSPATLPDLAGLLLTA